MNNDGSNPMNIDGSGASGPNYADNALDDSVMMRMLRGRYDSQNMYGRGPPTLNPIDPFRAEAGVNWRHGFIPGHHSMPAFPVRSALTEEQQCRAVRVLSFKHNRVQPYTFERPSKEDYKVYNEIYKVYEAEQKEFLKWAKILWMNGDCFRALRPKPVLEEIYDAEFKMRAYEVRSWPQNYVLVSQIQLETKNTTFEIENKSSLSRLEVERMAETKYPKLLRSPVKLIETPCRMPEPCVEHICRFVSPCEDDMTTLPMTELHRDLADYAVMYGCCCIMSENAMRCLIETDRKWTITVSVIKTVDADYGDSAHVLVLGSEFSVQKECSARRMYRAYKHLLYRTFAPQLYKEVEDDENFEPGDSQEPQEESDDDSWSNDGIYSSDENIVHLEKHATENPSGSSAEPSSQSGEATPDGFDLTYGLDQMIIDATNELERQIEDEDSDSEKLVIDERSVESDKPDVSDLGEASGPDQLMVDNTDEFIETPCVRPEYDLKTFLETNEETVTNIAESKTNPINKKDTVQPKLMRKIRRSTKKMIFYKAKGMRWSKANSRLLKENLVDENESNDDMDMQIESDGSTESWATTPETSQVDADAPPVDIFADKCTCKDTPFKEPPPRMYNSWYVNDIATDVGFKFIVHTAHKIKNGDEEILLEPIVEFQPELGGTRQSPAKIRSLYMSLMLRQSAKLLNVRVNHDDGEVIMMEKLAREDLSGKYGDMTINIADTLHTVINRLRLLRPGNYVLHHEPSHGSKAMLYTDTGLSTPSAKSKTLTIHRDDVKMPDAEEAYFAKNPPDLAPVLFPDHKCRGLLPLAFTPVMQHVRPSKKVLDALIQCKLAAAYLPRKFLKAKKRCQRKPHQDRQPQADGSQSDGHGSQSQAHGSQSDGHGSQSQAHGSDAQE